MNFERDQPKNEKEILENVERVEKCSDIPKCSDCKEREGIVKFCEGALAHSHGFTRNICRQCYIKRIEAGVKQAQDNLKKQKRLLAMENKK